MRTPTVTSTVPGAVAVLLQHFEAIAQANPALDVGVSLGKPTERVSDNYLIVGDVDTGQLLSAYSLKFMSSVSANRHEEEYGINCSLRVWKGDIDQLARLTEAFRLFKGVTSALQNDPKGNGQLTPSGTWQVSEMGIPVNGAFGDPAGWGVVMEFIVHVFNVRLTT